MRVVPVFLASPLHDDEPTPVTIEIIENMPEEVFPGLEGEERWDAHKQFYTKQAQLLADALYDALPQGTFDKLIVELMAKKVSIYRGREA